MYNLGKFSPKNLTMEDQVGQESRAVVRQKGGQLRESGLTILDDYNLLGT